jgi:hypothetical protein
MLADTFVALSRRLTLVTLPLPWKLLNADDVRAEVTLLAACGAAAVAGSMLVPVRPVAAVQLVFLVDSSSPSPSRLSTNLVTYYV